MVERQQPTTLEICAIMYRQLLQSLKPRKSLASANTSTSSFITYTYDKPLSAFKSAASANFAIRACP